LKFLDKDKAKSEIHLKCGCIFSYTTYFTSGFQSKSANEFMLEKYRTNPRVDTIDYLFMSNHDAIDLIKNNILIEKICADHFSTIFHTIYAGAREFFKEDLK